MSSEYYDISVSACGFLNRVRTVKPAEGEAYLVCTFAALRGAKGERAEPTYFDAKVVGDQARALLTQHENVINDRARNVFAAVRLSDLYVKSFVRERGERQGEPGFALKTRLLAIESLAIDGVVVYRRADDPATSARRSTRASGADAAAAAPSTVTTAGEAVPEGFRNRRAAAARR